MASVFVYIFQLTTVRSVTNDWICYLLICLSLVVARRLEKEVKQVLDEISYDQTAKERLIRGRQVDLAEELSKLTDVPWRDLSNIILCCT